MRIATSILFALATTIGISVPAAAADAAGGGPRIGEVRALALAPDKQDVISQLHRDGWLEARGQLLPAKACQDLFRMVGRTWTAKGVAADQFAIPDIQDRSQRSAVSSDNPFGVLGGGDLVTSGLPRKSSVRSSPMSYWIFVGQDVTPFTGSAH